MWIKNLDSRSHIDFKLDDLLCTFVAYDVPEVRFVFELRKITLDAVIDQVVAQSLSDPNVTFHWTRWKAFTITPLNSKVADEQMFSSSTQLADAMQSIASNTILIIFKFF